MTWTHMFDQVLQMNAPASSGHVDAVGGHETGPTTELRRLNWAVQAYARSSAALRRCDRLEDLASALCAAIVQNDVYVLAAVGLAEQSPAKPIRLVGGAGSAVGYLDGLNLSWSDEVPEGLGPSGRAIRDGLPHIMRDSHTDPAYALWRAKGARYGIRSSVTAPFKQDGRVIGALLVYASRPDAFGPDELAVFNQLGDELAFAMSLAEDRERLRAAEAAQRAAEEALRESQAELMRMARVSALGEFAASVAHEVNQPLAAIVTNSDASLRWLSNEPKNLEKAAEAIRRTIRDANRATDVVRRMRALVAKDEPQHVDMDLNEAIREVILLTQDEQQRAHVSVTADLDETLPPMKGDRIQIQQVVLNLVLNGIDAMRPGLEEDRRLVIRSVAAGDEALVEVRDQGVGLAPAGAERVFERFFTTKAGGTGLGLAIARSIVEAHGGRIWAEPAEPRGAAFMFTIPYDKDPQP